MNSLVNYGSDGENSDNSVDTKATQMRTGLVDRASDANYDHVQMDMSEDSNNNNSTEASGSERGRSPQDFQGSGRSERGRTSPEQRRTPDHHTSRDDHRRDRSDRYRHRRGSDDRRRDADSRDSRDSKDSRDRRSQDDDRRSREDDRRSSRHSSRDDAGRSSRDKKDHKEHHRDDRRDRRRDRRDRRHSRSDRKDRRREERSSHHKERERERVRSRSRSRSRSKSKEKPVVPFRALSYREERGRNKLAQLEKLGIELKTPEGNPVTANMEQSFYNPSATATQGKYAEQIQKRKLLWANKSKPDEGQTTAAVGGPNTWVGTTFTHDQDGKVSAKFKRLMGIKGDNAAPTPPVVGPKPDILKKQEEMFTNMEQQYEVARATTHTQRGVGLGYATGGYQFPR